MQEPTKSWQNSKPPRGTLQDLLAVAGIWQFEPGELEEILEDVEQSRLMELIEQIDDPAQRLELAIASYQTESISLAKAASLAGVSWPRMKDILLERGIQPRLGPETIDEAQQEIQALRDHFAAERETSRPGVCVRARVPSALVAQTGGQTEIDVKAETVQEVLSILEQRFPSLLPLLRDAQGALRPRVNVYVNDEHIRFRQGLDTPLQEGDTVLVMPFIMGG